MSTHGSFFLRALFAIAVLLPQMVLADAVNRGDTEAQVEQALGKPDSVLDAGVKKILFYETTKITLKNGVVIKVEAVEVTKPKPAVPVKPAAKTEPPPASATTRPVAPLIVEPSTQRSLYLGDGYTVELDVPGNFPPVRNLSGARHFPMSYQMPGFDERFVLTVASVSHEGNTGLSALDVARSAIEFSKAAYEEFALKFNELRVVNGRQAVFYCYEGTPKGDPSQEIRFEVAIVKVDPGFIVVNVLGPAAEFRSIQPSLDAMLMSLNIEQSD